MIELYMIVCLLAHPEQCEEHRLDYASRNSAPMQLEDMAKGAAATWCNEHAGWFLRRLGSRPVGMEARA